MTSYSGRAYIVATIDGDSVLFDVRILRGGYQCMDDDVHTHLYLDPAHVLSKAQRRLPNGSVVRLIASVTMVFTQDYYGEVDSDLEVHAVRTLKVSTPSHKQVKRWAFDERTRAKHKPVKSISNTRIHSTQEIPSARHDTLTFADF